MTKPGEIEAFTPDITSSYGEGLTREVTAFVLELSLIHISEPTRPY